MCMTRLNSLNLDMPVIVEPMRAFASIRDLVTDVSWNYRVKKTIRPFKPRSPDAPDGTWRMRQADVERVQEFRKCIECFLCQDVCHVLRDHGKFDQFIGPRFLIYNAQLEMNPIDSADRLQDLKDKNGIRMAYAVAASSNIVNSGDEHRGRNEHDPLNDAYDKHHPRKLALSEQLS